MSVQVLVSTINQQKGDYSLLERLNIQSEAVIVNQCDREKIQVMEYKGNTITWIDTMERGLSRSRNMAIRNADAEICLLADDDEILMSGYPQIIENAFCENKEASVVRFRVKGIEKELKKYSSRKQKMGFLKSMKISSVEVAFRRKAIVDNKLEFESLLGTGAEFNHGEENVFMFDCLKKGLEIVYVPITIANVHIGKSSWFQGYNEEYFISSGASYAAMSHSFSWILILQFAVRRYGLYRKEMSFFGAIQHMCAGRKKYLSVKR